MGRTRAPGERRSGHCGRPAIDFAASRGRSELRWERTNGKSNACWAGSLAVCAASLGGARGLSATLQTVCHFLHPQAPLWRPRYDLAPSIAIAIPIWTRSICTPYRHRGVAPAHLRAPERI